MKRLLLLLLCAALTLSLCGCCCLSIPNRLLNEEINKPVPLDPTQQTTGTTLPDQTVIKVTTTAPTTTTPTTAPTVAPETKERLTQINYYGFSGEWLYTERYGYYGNGKLCSTTLYAVDFTDDSLPYFISKYTFLYLYDASGNMTERILGALSTWSWDTDPGKVILNYNGNDGGDTVIYPETESIEQAKFGVDASKTVQLYGEAFTVPTDKTWAAAYLRDAFPEEDPYDMATCQLFRADGDTLPELAIDYGVEAAGVHVFTQKNGVTDSVSVTHGYLQWIDGGNRLHFGSGQQGYYTDTVCRIDQGKFVTVGSGSYEEHYGDDGVSVTYAWNGSEVSESTYYQQLNSLYDRTQSTGRAANEYTFNQCRKLLQYIANGNA